MQGWVRLGNFVKKCENHCTLPHILQVSSVVEPEPEPQGAGTFGRNQSRYTEFSAPAPDQTQVVYLIIIRIE